MFAYVTIFQQAGQLQGIAEMGDRKQSRCVPWLSAFYHAETRMCREKPGCHLLKNRFSKTAWRHFFFFFAGRRGRIAREKEKSPEFSPQKAEEANKNASPSLRVSGQGGINMAMRDCCLRAALTSTFRVSCLSPPSGDLGYPRGSASLSESIFRFAW